MKHFIEIFSAPYNDNNNEITSINDSDYANKYNKKLNKTNIKNKYPSIIAEIKFSSPSRGRIYPGEINDPVEIAQGYIENGAVALSILTEPHRFEGDIKYIKAVREVFPQVPILLKDFILTTQQIIQAAQYGANAVLLIVSHLDLERLLLLNRTAHNLGLSVIIEVHNKEELDLALNLDPKIIGVNNRCLKSLIIDHDIARNLIAHIPEHIITICESGIHSAEQIIEMESLGYNGFLIGSYFMKHSHPGNALKKLIDGVIDAR